MSVKVKSKQRILSGDTYNISITLIPSGGYDLVVKDTNAGVILSINFPWTNHYALLDTQTFTADLQFGDTPTSNISVNAYINTKKQEVVLFNSATSYITIILGVPFHVTGGHFEDEGAGVWTS